jgi:hypothetical protein
MESTDKSFLLWQQGHRFSLGNLFLLKYVAHHLHHRIVQIGAMIVMVQTEVAPWKAL